VFAVDFPEKEADQFPKPVPVTAAAVTVTEGLQSCDELAEPFVQFAVPAW
jgi:hypothetical protein